MVVVIPIRLDSKCPYQFWIIIEVLYTASSGLPVIDPILLLMSCCLVGQVVTLSSSSLIPIVVSSSLFRPGWVCIPTVPFRDWLVPFLYLLVWFWYWRFLDSGLDLRQLLKGTGAVSSLLASTKYLSLAVKGKYFGRYSHVAVKNLCSSPALFLVVEPSPVFCSRQRSSIGEWWVWPSGLWFWNCGSGHCLWVWVCYFSCF